MVDKLYWSRNMHLAIILFLFFFKFFGLATFSLNNRRNSKIWSSKNVALFVNSKLGILYNLFVSFLIITLNFSLMPLIFYAEYAFRTNITIILETFQALLGSSVIILTLLSYCIFQSVIKEIGNYLIRIELILHRLQQPINQKYIFNLLFFVCLFKFIIFVALLFTEIIYFKPEPITLLGNLIPTIFAGLLFVQYFFVITLINEMFIKLNCIMQNFYQNRLDDFNSNILYQNRRIFLNCSRIHLLLQIRNIHDHLCNISREISQFYAFPTLTGLCFIFFTSLYIIYFFLAIFLKNINVDLILVINGILWIILLLCPFGLLTSKITKIVNEIEKTGCIVHILLNCVIDQKVKKELKQFSFQLLHQKIIFSTNGYFTLDNKFFQSI
ncbi:putative gustatory receptor 28a [Apis mellifera]|uniref:Gustatory receptor n=1 Tax=Apis mellifera TaxID=7460 RepID=A0A7M7MT14_APIME|nr:putative gustatory receptor 28a [Apis mellifera]|eukprot:XP_026300573.1 putative gustatory receptor 28a [Apis mellifera]